LPDHAALLPRLVAHLSPGGSLAVQIPDNLQEPAHVLMRQVASDGPWADKLVEAHKENATRYTPEWYYRLFRDQVTSIDIWRTTYHHALAGGPAAVVEWFKGSGLRPFLDPLNEDEKSEFVKRYEKALANAYTILPDGTVLLPFPRLFFVVTK
jgi:trans-aconitate 2-methyltransferase